jgi:hypothetical protein
MHALLLAVLVAAAAPGDKRKSSVHTAPGGRRVVTNLDSQADPLVRTAKDGRPTVSNEKPFRVKVEDALRDAGSRFRAGASKGCEAVEKTIHRLCSTR